MCVIIYRINVYTKGEAVNISMNISETKELTKINSLCIMAQHSTAQHSTAQHSGITAQFLMKLHI